VKLKYSFRWYEYILSSQSKLVKGTAVLSPHGLCKQQAENTGELSNPRTTLLDERVDRGLAWANSNRRVAR